MTQTKSLVVKGVSQMEGEFSKVLPGHIPSDKFVQNAITAINANPDLKSGNVDQSTIYSSLMKAAQDGLVVDGREAAIVTYNSKGGTKTAQYIPMVAGLLKKMRNTGEIASITYGVVYRNEYEQGRFKYIKGDHESLTHDPIMFEEKGDMIGVYAVVTLKDDTKIREFMDMKQLKKIQGSSKTGSSSYSPWNMWFEEMCVKSVLRKVTKLCPMSSDLDRVFKRDDGDYEEEAHVELGVEEIIEGQEKTKKKQTVASAAVKKKSAAAAAAGDGEADIIEAEIIMEESYDEDGVLPEAPPIEEDLPL